jgi:hypothetical protein
VNVRLPARWAPSLGALGMLGVLALLLVFEQVVQGAVLQGALRRAEAAHQHETTWRCQAMLVRRRINDCVAQVAPAKTIAAPPAQPAAPGIRVARGATPIEPGAALRGE